MIVDLIPKSIWKSKIRTRQRRLGNPVGDSESPLVYIDDYLLAANNIALKYFENNRNPLKKLWEYYNFNPGCGSHSTYTYAAFLFLTEGHKRAELQEEVRWVGGTYVSEKAIGHHSWLEKRVGGGWKAFETIPRMRGIPAIYAPWYTFQLFQNTSRVTSERFLGLLAISMYGFVNS